MPKCSFRDNITVTSHTMCFLNFKQNHSFSLKLTKVLLLPKHTGVWSQTLVRGLSVLSIIYLPLRNVGLYLFKKYFASELYHYMLIKHNWGCSLVAQEHNFFFLHLPTCHLGCHHCHFHSCDPNIIFKCCHSFCLCWQKFMRKKFGFRSGMIRP